MSRQLKPVSGPKGKIESEEAAGKALKKISTELVQQLNLPETILHLYAMDGLTSLEREKLNNVYVTELERKHYLVMTVIPSKGNYTGMELLKQALKESEQSYLFDALEKAYKEAVDALITMRLGLMNETGRHHFGQATVNGCGNNICDHLEYNNSEDVSLDPPVQERQHSSSNAISINIQISQGGDITVSQSAEAEPSSDLSFRSRSAHVSFRSNPYKTNLRQPLSVVVDDIPKISTNVDRNSLINVINYEFNFIVL